MGALVSSQGGIAKAWDTAEDQADQALMSLMEQDYPTDSKYKKVHDWFQSCMNTEVVEEKGASPLKPWLAMVIIFLPLNLTPACDSFRAIADLDEFCSQVDGVDSHDKLWDTLVTFQARQRAHTHNTP